MADALTMGGKVAAVAAGGALTGAPPEFLLTAVLGGAALSAYSAHGAQFEAKPRWVATVLGHAVAAAGFGYTASTAFVQAMPQLAQQYEIFQLTMSVSHWVWGVAFSWSSHWMLPILKDFVQNRVFGILRGEGKKS